MGGTNGSSHFKSPSRKENTGVEIALIIATIALGAENSVCTHVLLNITAGPICSCVWTRFRMRPLKKHRIKKHPSSLRTCYELPAEIWFFISIHRLTHLNLPTTNPMRSLRLRDKNVYTHLIKEYDLTSSPVRPGTTERVLAAVSLDMGWEQQIGTWKQLNLGRCRVNIVRCKGYSEDNFLVYDSTIYLHMHLLYVGNT